MTEIITATTTLTSTRPVVIVQLSSGNLAMVDYSLSVGDVMIALLLMVLVSLQVLQVWRNRGW
jgi:hypothetical protein